MNRTRIREALMAEGYSPTHCGICGRRLEPEPAGLFRHKKGRKRWRSVIDHDHESGFCRGFLCERCNSEAGWSSVAAMLANHLYFESSPARVSFPAFFGVFRRESRKGPGVLRLEIRVVHRPYEHWIPRGGLGPEAKAYNAYALQHSSVKYR